MENNKLPANNKQESAPKLVLDEAANKYAGNDNKDIQLSRIGANLMHAKINAFKAGAQWERGQYKQLLSFAYFAAEKLQDTASGGLAKMIQAELEKLKQ